MNEWCKNKYHIKENWIVIYKFLKPFLQSNKIFVWNKNFIKYNWFSKTRFCQAKDIFKYLKVISNLRSVKKRWNLGSYTDFSLPLRLHLILGKSSSSLTSQLTSIISWPLLSLQNKFYLKLDQYLVFFVYTNSLLALKT